MIANSEQMNIAQTNLQLYRQVRSLRHHQAALNQLHSAYCFAAEQCATLFRGSGKPFSCHLVGVASLCAFAGAPVETLIAALLHASYQARVGAAGQAGIDKQRDALANQFGSESERLVYGCFIASYDASANTKQPAPEPDLISPEESRWVGIILLADTLEDAHDTGLALHGNPGDPASRRGCALWRFERMQTERAALVSDAQTHNCPQFITLFDAPLAENAAQLSASSINNGPYTGRYSSFSVS